MNTTPFSFQIVGYPPTHGIDAGVPSVNDAGVAGELATAQNFKIPPVIWMFVFLVVGYLGLRMLLEEV